MNRPTRYLSVFAALCASAFAAEPAPVVTPAITVQQEVELYNAITALDRGTTKVIDSKPQAVPFTFSAVTRYTLAIDAGLVKPKAEAYEATALSIRAEIAPKGTEISNEQQQQLSAKLTPLFQKDDPLPPSLQKVSLADLNLDANPISIDVLTKLKPIIQQ